MSATALPESPTTADVRAMVAELKSAREFYKGHGHATQAITVGAYEGQVRLCDDFGAYDFRAGPYGWHYVSAGDVSTTLQSIATLAVQEINAKRYDALTKN